MRQTQQLDLRYIVPKSGTLSGITTQGLNMATSYNGQYVTICASGSIYVSTDFGVTSTIKAQIDVIFAVAMSSSGQYQVAVTTGVPTVDIYNSIDFGATWQSNFTAMTGPFSYNQWMQTVSISPNGKYILCGGSNGVRNHYSTDSGVTFSSFLSISDKITSAVTNDGFAYTVGETGNFSEYDLTVAPANLSESTSFLIGGTSRDTSPGCVAFASDGQGNAHASPAGVGYLNNRALVQVLNPTRTDFEQISFANNRLWARSSTSVCTSVDYGATWDTVYVGTPRTFAVSLDNKILYVLLQNGSLLRSSLPFFPPLFPGYKIENFGADVPFGTVLTNYVSVVSVTLPPGIWSLFGSFVIKPGNNTEDSVTAKHIAFGLTDTLANLLAVPNLFYEVIPYESLFGVPRTHAKITCSRIVKFDVPTTVTLRAKLNIPIPTPTNTTATICDSPSIQCFLIAN